MTVDTVTEVQAPLPEDDAEAFFQAPALLRVLWADPKNMAEHIAIWSLKYFGPRAGSAVERLRASHANASQEELERLAIEHQTRVCMTEGAFVGGPFIVLIPVAFCAALLAQAQMAFELAARWASGQTAFYAAQRTEETGVTVARVSTSINVGVAAGFVRMLLLIAALALLTDTDIGGGKWISALIALLVVSALATLGWLALRWGLRRRSRSRPAEATISQGR